MPTGQCESYRAGYSQFLFVLEKLDRRRFTQGILVFYGYHVEFSAVFHGKLILYVGR